MSDLTSGAPGSNGWDTAALRQLIGPSNWPTTLDKLLRKAEPTTHELERTLTIVEALLQGVLDKHAGNNVRDRAVRGNVDAVWREISAVIEGCIQALEEPTALPRSIGQTAVRGVSPA